MTTAHRGPRTHSDFRYQASKWTSGSASACLATILAALVFGLGGCGGDPGGAGNGPEPTKVTGFAKAPSVPQVRYLNLDRAVLFHKSDAAAESGLCGGLHVWGDLDGDGYDDIIVALTRKGGVKSDLGWLEAWSPSTGQRLWQVTGTPSRPSEDKKRLIAGYSIGEIAKIGDVDRDGIHDIYCQRRQKGTILIYSGKSGQLIENRYDSETPTFVTPIRSQDVDADGVADNWFVSQRPSRFVVETAVGGKHIRDFPLYWPGIDPKQGVTVAIPHFTDANSDGFSEVLVYRSIPNPGGRTEELEMAIMDGRSLEVLHKISTPAPNVFGETSFAAPGDVTGDGLPDIAKAAVCGEGDGGHTSFMQMIDGATGSVVWKVTGDQAGGVQEFAVETGTGKRTALPPDIKYGGPIHVIHDVDRDGVAELATVCQTEEGAAGALFVHSGRDGRLLGTVAPQGDEARLSDRTSTQAVILAGTKSGKPEMVLTGRNKKGEAILILLELPG